MKICDFTENVILLEANVFIGKGQLSWKLTAYLQSLDNAVDFEGYHSQNPTTQGQQSVHGLVAIGGLTSC